MFKGKLISPRLTKRNDVGIFADADIPTGTVILTEIPDASFASEENFCDLCLLPGNPMFSCEKVYIVVVVNSLFSQCGETYCSLECKQQAFFKYHKVICGTKWIEMKERARKTVASSIDYLFFQGSSASSFHPFLIAKLVATFMLSGEFFLDSNLNILPCLCSPYLADHRAALEPLLAGFLDLSELLRFDVFCIFFTLIFSSAQFTFGWYLNMLSILDGFFALWNLIIFLSQLCWFAAHH
jgi:hypothetical protein